MPQLLLPALDIASDNEQFNAERISNTFILYDILSPLALRQNNMVVVL